MEIFLLTAFVLLVGFGGIFYILPSKRQRQLSKCRLDARAFNFLVNSVSLPKVDSRPEERVSAGGKRRKPTLLCCSYTLPSYDIDPITPTWQLVRSENSVVPFKGWEFSGGLPVHVQLSNKEYWDQIQEFIKNAPPKCLAVVSEPTGVSWIGQEQISDSIENFLSRLKDNMQEFQSLNQNVIRPVEDSED